MIYLIALALFTAAPQNPPATICEAGQCWQTFGHLGKCCECDK